jgi:DNA-binding response OmpR family regulator
MKKRILLVDDSKPILSLLTSLFSANYEVNPTDNVPDALKILQSGVLPDLIISDLNMPNINGQEFITHLKDGNFFHDIPILVLSGNQNISERINLLKKGVDDYVVKPFNPEELYLRAEKLLRKKQVTTA